MIGQPTKITPHSSLTNQKVLNIDQSGGTLARPIRRHFGSTNQEALKFDNQEALLLYQSGGILAAHPGCPCTFVFLLVYEMKVFTHLSRGFDDMHDDAVLAENGPAVVLVREEAACCIALL